MNDLYSPNSKLMNPEKKLYSLIDVNLFLMILGLFPLKRVPTSKIIIQFFQDRLSVVIQPVEVWRIETLKIPNYERMTFDYEESIFPYVKLMHFDIEYHADIPKDLSLQLKSKKHKMDKGLEKRGKYLNI